MLDKTLQSYVTEIIASNINPDQIDTIGGRAGRVLY